MFDHRNNQGLAAPRRPETSAESSLSVEPEVERHVVGPHPIYVRSHLGLSLSVGGSRMDGPIDSGP